ncbi:MAG: M48 family metallopeptidase [Candidatus Krumholzibacteria bacterium]|nr:M48 family metallopeptidase [Candidatus Krumholzibacteria bacterium]
MRMLEMRWIRAAAAATLLAAAGCAATGINKGQFNIISSDEEVSTGAEFASQVDSQFTIHDDPVLTAYVQSVGDRVTAVCDRRDIEYRFAVIREDQVNAFALPGGYIYLYTGLMKTIDDEAQLAAVIAHEVGHVTARHATERLTAMYGYQVVASLILGSDPNRFASLVAGIFSTTGFLAYSRSNEFEADRLGTTYAYQAGYDPAGMSELLGKFLDTEQRQPSKLESWLSTHPPTADRISGVQSVIASLPARAGGTRNAAAFAKMKARLP